MEEFNNKIIICDDNNKDNILKKINGLLNIKFITLNELKKKYYFDYDKEALYFICNKYNVIYDVAKKYIESIYLINDEVHSEKIDFLNIIKKDLIENNLIYYDELFKNFLNNKDIVIYNLSFVDKFYSNIFNELKKTNNVSYFTDDDETSVKELYCLNNMECEISFLANKICDLIKNGVDINKIKLINVQSDYKFNIKKIFNMFNINVELGVEESISGTLIVKKFKELYESNISNTIEKLKKYVITSDDEDIFKKIVGIVNSFYFVEDYMLVKEYIYEEIDNTMKKSIKYDNAVRVISLKELTDEDYGFLINFNEGVYPTSHKDEKYLSDKELILLHLSTSEELNKLETESTHYYISHCKNLTVSYIKKNIKGEAYISGCYRDDLFKKVEYNPEYENSDIFNRMKLIKLKDDNRKYGTISDELSKLESHYHSPYLTYDNKYKLIDKDKLYNYLGNKLQLSYSSMNNYYLCGFRYYLNNVLKVNKFEDTFFTILGKIYHKILSECFYVENYDFDFSWNREIEFYNKDYEFNPSEKFFLSNLKEELVFVIETIKNQLKHTSLKKIMCEKEIIVSVDENLHVTFKGFVDKILYDEFEGYNVCAVVDYKTGDPKVSINNISYGLDMQLPIYIYLIKNSNVIKDVRIGGFYLQNIVVDEKDENKKLNELKLHGYSNSDRNVLEKVDDSYENSQMIRSLKVTNEGNFYYYSKVISDENINTLNNIVESKIKEASNNILNAKFDINPIQIADNNKGCEFCEFKDICYMKNSDIRELPKPQNIFSEEEGE